MKRAFSVFCLLVSLAAQATVVPDGQGFRKGKLDNGLTYYLYHNESPKGCADFFIAHNVGALQEDDNQNGLAHFLEHMAFNGTAHYPDKGILDFLAREGVRFGANVNAYTSRTETVYNISRVPLVRESFVDSVLLAVRDWSCDISCEQDAIDAERGVIHEEWRNRDGQRYRMANRQTQILYKGGKHPDRTVLGDMDIILNFKREEILDFYHRWYRPDLQAVVVVGDIDLDDIEARIRRTFSDVPASVNPEQKGNYAPPVQEGPVFEDMTDPQLRYTALKVFAKQEYPAFPKNSVDYFKDLLSRQVVTSVVGEHLERKCQEKDSPAKSAVIVLGDESPYFYMNQFTLAPKSPDSMAECLRMTCTEIERVARHGISEDEFEQAKVSVMKRSRLGAEEAVSAPDNSDIAKACVQSFLNGFPCTTPEELRTLKREVLENLEYSEVAPLARKMFSEAQMVYSNCYNEKDAKSIPTEAQMRSIIDGVRASEIASDYIVYDHFTIEANPSAGKIVKVRKAGEKDYVCWTLSNGAKVWWTKSQPVDLGYHLSLEFRFDTGMNAFPDEEVPSVGFASAFMNKHCGFSGKDRPELITGPSMSGLTYYTNTIKGRYAVLSVNSSESRIEDAFKVAYLRITDPFPGKESNLEIARLDALQSLAKRRLPTDIHKTNVDNVRYGNHPWLAERDSASVQRVDMDYLKHVIDRLYGDPSRLEVFLCSDMSEEQAKALVEKYIASLPCVEKARFDVRNKALVPSYRGVIRSSETFAKRTSPFTEIEYNWLSAVKDKPRMHATADILDYIMSFRCLNQIREARGGTYHVSFYSELYRVGKKAKMESTVKFRTRAELRDVLLSDVEDIMAGMCADGPLPEEMENAVKYLVKYDSERKDRNQGSVAARNDRMMSFVRHGDREYDYAVLVRSITPDEVRKLARQVSSSSRFISIYEEE